MGLPYTVKQGSTTIRSNLAPDASNIDEISGKGSWRRPADLASTEVAARWCATFGHKIKYGACLNCGQPSAA